MIAKVNFSIKLKAEKNIYKIKLFDVDLFKDDLLKEISITNSGSYEFLFAMGDTGEFRPELQIRIFNASDLEIYRSEINKELNSMTIDNNTGRNEKTTIDFNAIEL